MLKNEERKWINWKYFTQTMSWWLKWLHTYIITDECLLLLDNQIKIYSTFPNFRNDRQHINLFDGRWSLLTQLYFVFVVDRVDFQCCSRLKGTLTTDCHLNFLCTLSRIKMFLKIELLTRNLILYRATN